MCFTTGAAFFGALKAAASACRCIACDSGFASRSTAATRRRTSSMAATRLATIVAVRQGRINASGAGSGASTAPLVSLRGERLLRPRPRSLEALLQRYVGAPAELLLDQRDVERGAVDVPEARVRQTCLCVA